MGDRVHPATLTPEFHPSTMVTEWRIFAMVLRMRSVPFSWAGVVIATPRPIALGLTVVFAWACGNANDGDSESTLPSGIAGAGGAAATITSAQGGSAIGAGGTSNAIGGLPNEGGTSAKDDSAEKGLCSASISCDAPIVDEPGVLCGFELRDSLGTAIYAEHASVELRGRSSMNFPKKNYGIELQDAAGVEKPTNLLGMGQDSDWILDGAWADRSFMRNRLSFALFRDMSPDRWAPQSRYCKLTLNGKYAGIYALEEKIKRDDDRVALPDDDGTGATFIVKQDNDGTLRLTIGSGTRWQVVYPSQHVITATQTQAIQAWMDKLGAALTGSNPADLLTLLDAATVTDWILLEEFSKNIDAYNLSIFFARSAGGLARPIPWDMDLSYGQPTLKNATNESPEGWVYNRTVIIAKLSSIPSLRQGLGTRWRELRATALSDASIQKHIDAYAAVLTPDAVAENFALWPIAKVDFTSIYAPYSFYDVATYDEEMTHFRDWIQKRLVWIDANIDSYPSK